MKKFFLLGILLSYSANAQEGKHIDFDLNGGPYISYGADFYLLNFQHNLDKPVQLGIGFGETLYEVYRDQKAVGLNASLSLMSQKKVTSNLFLSNAILVGYEGFRFKNTNYDLASLSGPGFIFYGANIGFSYKDNDSPITMTIGVEIKGVDHLSDYLKNTLDQNGLAYPSTSIFPFMRVGMVCD